MSREARKLLQESRSIERHEFGKKTSIPPIVDDVPAYGTTDEFRSNDEALQNMLYPSFDDQLNHTGSSLTGFSIMEEINEQIINGLLAPFIEGTPIGPIPVRYTKPKNSRNPHKKQPSKMNGPMGRDRARMITGQRRQESMLAWRKKNDRKLELLIGGSSGRA